MSTDDTTRYDSCDAWLRKQAPGFVPAESLIWALCNFVQGHTPEPTNAEELEQEIKDLRKINTAHVSRARRLGQRAKEALGVGKADRAKDRDDAGLGAGFEGAFDLLIARLCGMQHIIAMVLKNYGHGGGCEIVLSPGSGNLCNCWREELRRVTP